MPEDRDAFERALAELHFPTGWFAFGALDAAMVIWQAEEYQRGEDPHREHYRYRAYMGVIVRGGLRTEEDVRRFIELVAMDEDRTMATATLIRLIKWPGLSDALFDVARQHPALHVPPVQRVIAQLVARKERRWRSEAEGI